jgi:hypothetical protein
MRIHSPTITGSAANTNIVTTTRIGSLSALSASYAATSSYADSFTVGGTITAQTINVQYITSSIEFNTGSTRNGSLAANTHQFTGSVLMSGSLTAGGNSIFNTNNGTLSADILTVKGGGGTGAYGFKVQANNGDNIFYTNNYTYDVITNAVSGKFGIGTSTPTTILTISKAIDSAAYGSGTRMIDFKSYFAGYDVDTVKASIYGGVSGIGSLNTQGGYMAFMTSNDGTLAERVRIEKNGNTLIGTTTDNGYKLNVNGNIYGSYIVANDGLGASGGIVINYGYAYGLNSNNQTAANAWNFYVSTSFSNNLRFFYGGTGVGAGTAKAQIDTSGNYSALSDRNKKKDIAITTLGLNEVLQLKPSSFKFIDDEKDEEQLGFIAQEVKDVIPHAYYEDAEGDDKFIGLKYNAMVPVLVKAIQELKSENDTLKEILQRNNIQ